MKSTENKIIKRGSLPIELSVFIKWFFLLFSLTFTIFVNADTDTRSVSSELSTIPPSHQRLPNKDPLFNLNDQDCFLPGDVLSFKGQSLIDLTNYHIVLRAERQFIPLKQLSISKQQILLQIPRDTALNPGQIYPIVLLARSESESSASKPTGNSIKICPRDSKLSLLPTKEVHENGEILVLSHSGLTDAIIQEGSKLGYLLLRRHQLNSVNLTLLVLGGAEKNLEKVREQLSATFPDAQVDFNHHFFTSEQTNDDLINAEPNWPHPGNCHYSPKSKVTVGILDGDIDMSHPALAAKSIKIRNFLLPGQPIEQDHATAIAVLLVGTQPNKRFEGFVPFIELRAANVVRKEDPTPVATAESIARAIDWFINEKVRLVNVSLTSPSANKITSRMFFEASKAGLIIFTAAGNDSKRLTTAYPGVLPDIITITAVDDEGSIYSEANQGDYIDFAAPGVDVWTASTDNAGQYRSGTSLAVPYAVSIAAIYLAHQPNYSREALYQNMQHDAIDLGSKGYDRRYGWGQIRINRDLCQP